METENKTRKERIYSAALRGFAVIGLITVLIGVSWGFVRVAQGIPALSGFASAIVSITSQFFPAEEDGSQNATTTPDGDDGTQNGGTTATPSEPQQGTRTEDVRQLTGSSGSGPADLAVNIDEVGIIDPETEEFVATSTYTTSDRIAVRFSVQNVGGERYDRQWNFRAVLPVQPQVTSNMYDSSAQRPLGPGDRVEYTLGFDRADREERDFVININPENRLRDANDDNNIDRVTITPTTTPSN